MNATEIIARLIDSKAINGEEAMCLLQSTKPMEEVFSPFNQVKEFGTHGNPYSPVYPIPDAYGVISATSESDAVFLLQQFYTEAFLPEEPKETITIGNDTYEVTEELKSALKNLKKI